MPRFDQTGPMGFGPMTGYGMGRCGNFDNGMGFRRFYTKKEESKIFYEEVGALEAELRAVKERLAELER